eukprot:gene5699-7867_t
MAGTIAVSILMIIWWLTNAAPMGVTSLLPMILFPILGVSKASSITYYYFSDGVSLCWGSLIVAGALERYNVHRRLASIIIGKGNSIHSIGQLIPSFVLVTGFMSMWLSNTATAALMIPIANAITTKMKSQNTNCKNYSHKNLCAAIDLSIAYAALIGGTATLTGTGTNIVLAGTMLSMFGNDGQISFMTWFYLSAPLTFINLLTLIVVILTYFSGISNNIVSSTSKILGVSKYILSTQRDCEDDLETENSVHDIHQINGGTNSNDDSTSDQSQLNDEENTPITYPEVIVILSFALMALLWITRAPPGNWGWSLLLKDPDYVSDGTVALFCCFLLFIIPATPPTCIVSIYNYFKRKTNNSTIEFQMVSKYAHDVTEFTFISDSNHNSEENNPRDTSDSLGIINNNQQSDDNDESQMSTKFNEPILCWISATKSMNWDVIFLLGGGFALSSGFQSSGLSTEISNLLTSGHWSSFSELTIVASFAACAITNFMSNIACANILIPSLACIGPSHNYDPLAMLMPVTIAISIALLFPIGSPPNAFALANNNTSVKQMFIVGFILAISSSSLHGTYSPSVICVVAPRTRLFNAFANND